MQPADLGLLHRDVPLLDARDGLHIFPRLWVLLCLEASRLGSFSRLQGIEQARKA